MRTSPAKFGVGLSSACVRGRGGPERHAAWSAADGCKSQLPSGGIAGQEAFLVPAESSAGSSHVQHATVLGLIEVRDHSRGAHQSAAERLQGGSKPI